MRADELDDLYRRHGPSVLRRARQLLGNDHDAQEALQDVFLSLARDRTQFGGRSALTTWLYSVTTHLCLNRLRDGRQRLVLLSERSVSPDPNQAAPSAERLAILRQLLARLPEELAIVAAYHYVDEMTHDEIATVIGCSRRHVGDLIARARAFVAQEVDR